MAAIFDVDSKSQRAFPVSWRLLISDKNGIRGLFYLVELRVSAGCGGAQQQESKLSARVLTSFQADGFESESSPTASLTS